MLPERCGEVLAVRMTEASSVQDERGPPVSARGFNLKSELGAPECVESKENDTATSISTGLH
jgi:hypothetical protein